MFVLCAGGVEFPVVAYLRVKDEIKTIEACLNSIDGVFDRIVIIHSNEKDDGSVAFMTKWCHARPYCEIHEYPYEVIPSHDIRNSQAPKFENTLAAYNNFGLSFFEPEEWVVKIDADQVYFKERLQEAVNFVKKNGVETTRYSLKGYNTFAWNNHLVKFKAGPINGIYGDSYFIKKKYINYFQHSKNFEFLKTVGIQSMHIFEKPVWFHFMKSLKSNGSIRENDTVHENEVLFLTEAEKELFEKEIRPLLKNSPYYDLKLERTPKKTQSPAS